MLSMTQNGSACNHFALLLSHALQLAPLTANNMHEEAGLEYMKQTTYLPNTYQPMHVMHILHGMHWMTYLEHGG
jgi:hypothetical protein